MSAAYFIRTQCCNWGFRSSDTQQRMREAHTRVTYSCNIKRNKKKEMSWIGVVVIISLSDLNNQQQKNMKNVCFLNFQSWFNRFYLNCRPIHEQKREKKNSNFCNFSDFYGHFIYLLLRAVYDKWLIAHVSNFFFIFFCSFFLVFHISSLIESIFQTLCSHSFLYQYFNSRV